MIGDSALDGCEKLFQRSVVDSWVFEVHRGAEALTVACNDNGKHDLVAYVTAGNGGWSAKKHAAKITQNIQSFDPEKVVVVLLGTIEGWSKLSGDAANNATFFDNARELLMRQGVRFIHLDAFMKTLTFTDKNGHIAESCRPQFVDQLLATFRELAAQPLPTPTRSLGLAATSPDTNTIVSRLGAGGDVLSGPEYEGWEADLREQHGVVHPKLRPADASWRSGWWWCVTCECEMPSYTQVITHINGKQHKKATGAAPKFVPQAAALDTEGWPRLLRHAMAGNAEEVTKALEEGDGPNATAAPDDDRTALWWAAWEGHALVVKHLLLDPTASALYKQECQGRDGVPPHPCAPIEAAHDRWGKESNAFIEFGIMISRVSPTARD